MRTPVVQGQSLPVNKVRVQPLTRFHGSFPWLLSHTSLRFFCLPFLSDTWKWSAYPNVKHVEGQVWSLNVKEDCHQKKETVSYMICPPMVDLPASEKEEVLLLYTVQPHINGWDKYIATIDICRMLLSLSVLHLSWKKVIFDIDLFTLLWFRDATIIQIHKTH